MLQKDPAKRLPVARVLSSPWTSRPQAYQPSVKPTLSPGAGDITRSLPSAPGELIAAANEAMKTAKQAALSAEIAAAEARAAETNAQLALAAAADAQISRSSSPQAVSRNASRGVFGTNGKGSSSSPLSGAPAAWGGDITWVLGRASNGEDNAKGLAASRGARMSRSALEAIDGGEQEPGRRGDGDSTGSHASISMRSTWEQGDNRPSQEHGSNKSKGAAGGVFATTSASSLTTGTAAILARRRLLLRSQSTATSSDKMEVTFYRADPAPIVDDAVLVSPAGKDGGEHAGGRHDSVRDRAERASVKFGRSWSMGEDLQGTSAAGVRSSSPPTTEPLSAAFAASSSMMSNATAVESTFQAERPSLTGLGVTCDVGVDSARTAKSLATKAGAEENSANDAGFRKQKARGGISESLFVATRSMFRTYENSSPSAAGDKRTSLHEIGSPPRKILAVETTVEEMAAEENKQAIRSSELCDEPLADRSTEPTGEHAGTGDARESAAPASAQTCAKDKSAESLAPTQSAPEPSTEQVSQGQKASREAPATVTVEPKVEQAAAELTKQSTAREPSRDELAAGSTALTSADTSTTDRLADPPIPTQGAQEPPKAQVADKLRLQTSAESVMVEKSVECPAPVQGSSAPLQPSCETVLSHSKLAADESAVTPATSTLAGPGTSSATHAPGARDDASGPCSPAPLSKRATLKELSKSSHGRPMPHRSPSPPKRPSQAAPSVYRRASRRSLSASPKRATRSLRLSNERGRSSERLELSNEGGGSRSRSAGSRPGTAPEFDAPPCLPAPSAPSAGDARMDEDTAETDESTEETEDMEPAKEAGGDSAAVQEADDEDSGVLTESPDLAPASINLRKLAEDDNIWLMADAGSASRRHASSRHAAGERGTGKASPRRATSLSMRLSSSIGLLGQSSSVFNSTGAVRMNGGDASVGSRRASTGKGGKEGDTKKSRPRGKRFVRSVARIIFGRRDSKPAQARPRARSADGN